MAEDMIECVARRLWDHSFDRTSFPSWENTSDLQKRFYRMLAREAIAEMREPTEAMVNAAYVDDAPADGWRMMIDAALHNQTEPRDG